MATLQVIAGIQASRKGGEVLETVLRDHARVLDAHSTEPLEIEARLDRHDVAPLKNVLVWPAEPRLLVHVQPDAVAGRVVHLGAAVRTFVTLGRRPVASIHQDLADAVVNFAAGRTGLDRLDAGVERLQDRGMHAADLIWNLSHD